MPFAPIVSGGFFPLDEELQLLPGRLTPALAESLVHLGTWMPFGRAVKEVHYFHRVHLTEATVRRETETAGAAYVTVQTDQVEHLERTTPTPPAGPPLQLMSVDGAFIRLVHGEWAEVKTLAMGDVQPPVTDAKTGESVVHSTNLSYFSRLADAETFGRLALVETQRRGTETATQVCAVSDGAEWEQGFVDLHRREAVRILDFRHAGGYVVAAGDAVWGEGSDASKAWWKKMLHELKHGSPDQVLDQVRELQRQTQAAGPGNGATRTTLETSLGYLDKRRAQIEYAQFQALGYPIGSGSVESGNKLVVEARLKGAGMHWARPHVDPLLALRNIACSDRWDEAWPQITTQLRRQARTARLQRFQKRQTPSAIVSPTNEPAQASPPVVASPGRIITPPPAPAPLETPSISERGTLSSKRPAANHPWRHTPIGRARFQPTRRSSDAKL
jgi:hypothetical protein